MSDAPTTKPGLPGTLQTQLRSMSSDMTFLGIFEIVIGAIYCITIIGAALGIPLIFAGLRLKNSAGSFVAYTAAPESANLRTALEHLGKHFRIHKILVIISIAFMLLYIIIMVVIVGMVIGGATSGAEWE